MSGNNQPLATGRDGNADQTEFIGRANLLHGISHHRINAGNAEAVLRIVADKFSHQFVGDSRAKALGSETQHEGSIDARHGPIMGSGAGIQRAGPFAQRVQQPVGKVPAELIETGPNVCANVKNHRRIVLASN